MGSAREQARLERQSIALLHVSARACRPMTRAESAEYDRLQGRIGELVRGEA
ncbi:MAG: hypothetical protein M3R38_06860 [Actinomycetota bacterium]|nr:hypothetical protein [Actinomycetota bacterium]